MGLKTWIKTLIDENPKKVKVFKTIITLLSLGITIYLVVSAIKRYQLYQNRGKYVLLIKSITNMTYSGYGTYGYNDTYINSKYYIARENASTANCSSDAEFPVDVTSMYSLIVTRGPASYIFLVVFWLNIATVICLVIWDCVMCIKSWTSKEDEDSKSKNILWSVIDKAVLKIWLMTTITAPTYYISAFDYSDICLKYQTSLDLVALTYVPVAITFPLLGVLGLAIGWCCSSYTTSSCVTSCRVSDAMRMIIRKVKNSKESSLGCVKTLCLLGFVCQIGYSLLFVFGIGTLLCVLLFLKQSTRGDAGLIIANLFV